MPNLTPISYSIIALICLLGIFHQWGDNAFPWWRLALATYLVALAYEGWRTRLVHLRVELAATQRLRLGQAADLSLVFHNPDVVGHEINYAIGLPSLFEASRAEHNLKLRGDGATTALIPAAPVAVGRAVCKRLAVRLLGPLRLGWWKRNVLLDAALEVVPDSLSRNVASVGLSRAGGTTQQRQGSGRELHHLREYRPGDPRHTIDWKASAKSGQLVTRVFGEDQHLDIILILDCGRTSRTRIDGLSQLGHYINLTARFAELAVANEDRIGMVAVTDRTVAAVPPGRGTEAVTRIRRELSRLQTETVESDILTAAREIGAFTRHRCLILVLTDLYGADSTGQLNQCVRLWAGQHLPMVIGLVGRELQQISSRDARDWLDPWLSLAASSYTEELQRGMQGLRSLGAQTLLARPRDLESSVFSHYHRLKAQRRI